MDLGKDWVNLNMYHKHLISTSTLGFGVLVCILGGAMLLKST